MNTTNVFLHKINAPIFLAKKKQLLLIIVCVMMQNLFFAQQKKLDSLQTLLTNHLKEDAIKVDLLNKISRAYFRINLTKSAKNAQKGALLAKKIKDNSGESKSLTNIALAYMYKGKFDTATTYINKSKEIAKSLKNKKTLSNCHNILGLIYFYQQNYTESLKAHQQSLKIAIENNLEEHIASSYNNIANIYNSKGNYDEAISAYKNSQKIIIKLGDQKKLAQVLNNLALIYEEKGDFNHSLSNFLTAINIYKKLGNKKHQANTFINIGMLYKKREKYTKALKYEEKARLIFKGQNNLKGLTTTLNNIGSIYKNKGEYKKAFRYYHQSLKISKEINNREIIAHNLNNIGDLQIQIQQPKKALINFKKALKINLILEHKNNSAESYLGIGNAYFILKEYKKALQNALKSKNIAEEITLVLTQSKAYLLLSEIYASTNQYKKAFEYYKKHKIISDRLFNKKSIEKATQLEFEYKYKEQIKNANTRELKLIEKVIISTKNLEKTQRNSLLAVIGFLMIIIILGAVIFYQKLKNIKSTNENILIEQKLLRSQMTPHFIFNSLSILQGMILSREEKKSIFYLSKFSKLLRIILENSRNKTVPLKEELDAVDNYLVLQNLGMKSPFIYTVSVDTAIDISYLLIPPMIIQPFVENAIKYAFIHQKENKKIDIHIQFVANNLICTITDNGIGIDMHQKNLDLKKKSLSTTITSKRLKMLSKEFGIKTSLLIEDRKKYAKKGTLVTLTLPYKIIKND